MFSSDRSNQKTMMLETVSGYVGAGLSVIPTDPVGKNPRVPSWTSFQTDLPTPNQIKDWFGKVTSPEAGLNSLGCTSTTGARGITKSEFKLFRETFRISRTLNGRWELIPTSQQTLPGF